MRSELPPPDDLKAVSDDLSASDSRQCGSVSPEHNIEHHKTDYHRIIYELLLG